MPRVGTCDLARACDPAQVTLRRRVGQPASRRRRGATTRRGCTPRRGRRRSAAPARRTARRRWSAAASDQLASGSRAGRCRGVSSVSTSSPAVSASARHRCTRPRRSSGSSIRSVAVEAQLDVGDRHRLRAGRASIDVATQLAVEHHHHRPLVAGDAADEAVAHERQPVVGRGLPPDPIAEAERHGRPPTSATTASDSSGHALHGLDRPVVERPVGEGDEPAPGGGVDPHHRAGPAEVAERGRASSCGRSSAVSCRPRISKPSPHGHGSKRPTPGTIPARSGILRPDRVGRRRRRRPASGAAARRGSGRCRRPCCASAVGGRAASSSGAMPSGSSTASSR